jgi:Gpi18-like mannosyltransferase
VAATIETRQTEKTERAPRAKPAVWLNPDWRIIATVFALKAVVFVFAAQSYQIISNNRLHGFRGWLDSLARWDTVHFLNIAQNGYSGTGPDRILLAFFPLYPWTTRGVAYVAGDYLISALLVSTAASVAVALLLFRLARQDFPESIAERAVWFLFIFPTSYFLHFAYTESLFMALALGALLAARKKLWMAAGLLGALACLTRITGLVLTLALVAEVIEEFRRDRRFDPRWLWIAVVPAGFAVYLLINSALTGDPFAFLAIQKEHWHKSAAPPWTGIRQVLDSISWRPAGESQVMGTQEFLFIVLGLVGTIYSWVKLRIAYSVWMTANWLIFTGTSFVYSVPRYALTLFPVFILFGRVAQNPLWNSVITAWSLTFLALFSTLFVCGYWAY